ncbi:S8/S53 family peptidase [Knoellia sp. CPCC 206453]|uniref:S8/S53 family peptidase n=1 Tax=Knoellia pratensis TaxID=3404796 RepID=UPI0036233983
MSTPPLLARCTGVALTAAVAAATVTLGAASAGADPLTDGQWWSTAMGVDELHRSGAGQGITVALIDGPIDSSVPELKGRVASSQTECVTADGSPQKSTVAGLTADHATMMASLLVGSGKGTASGGRGVAGIAPQVTLRHYAVAFGTNDEPEKLRCQLKGGVSDAVDDATARAIRQAVRDGARIISISLTTDYTDEYIPALLDAYRAGAIVVASTNNDRRNVFWPAIGNGVVTVTHVDAKGNLDDSAVRGSSLVDFAAPGTKIAAGRWTPSGWRSDVVADGSSQATAITAGGLAAVWSAHPSATGNQVLQAAKDAIGLRAENGTFLTWFRRVGADLPEATGKTESYGFGIFSPADAIKLDVEKLSTVNPMVTERGTEDPSAADIAAATAASASSAPTPSASSSASTPATGAATKPPTKASGTSDNAALPWLGAGVLGLLVVGGVLLVVRRRSTAHRPAEREHDPTAAADGAAATTKENSHA